MDPWETQSLWQKALARCNWDFIKKIDPTEIIWRLKPLLSRGDSDYYYQQLRLPTTPQERCEKLLDILPRTERWWNPFIKALRDCGYGMYADMLKDRFDEIATKSFSPGPDGTSKQLKQRASSRRGDPHGHTVTQTDGRVSQSPANKPVSKKSSLNLTTTLKHAEYKVLLACAALDCTSTAGNYQDLAGELGLSWEDMSQMERNKDSSPAQQVVQLFSQRNPEEATLGNLMRALQNIKKLDVLQDICQITNLEPPRVKQHADESDSSAKESSTYEKSFDSTNQKVNLEFPEPDCKPDGLPLPTAVLTVESTQGESFAEQMAALDEATKLEEVITSGVEEDRSDTRREELESPDESFEEQMADRETTKSEKVITSGTEEEAREAQRKELDPTDDEENFEDCKHTQEVKSCKTDGNFAANIDVPEKLKLSSKIIKEGNAQWQKEQVATDNKPSPVAIMTDCPTKVYQPPQSCNNGVKELVDLIKLPNLEELLPSSTFSQKTDIPNEVLSSVSGISSTALVTQEPVCTFSDNMKPEDSCRGQPKQRQSNTQDKPVHDFIYVDRSTGSVYCPTVVGIVNDKRTLTAEKWDCLSEASENPSVHEKLVEEALIAQANKSQTENMPPEPETRQSYSNMGDAVYDLVPNTSPPTVIDISDISDDEEARVVFPGQGEDTSPGPPRHIAGLPPGRSGEENEKTDTRSCREPVGCRTGKSRNRTFFITCVKLICDCLDTITPG